MKPKAKFNVDASKLNLDSVAQKINDAADSARNFIAETIAVKKSTMNTSISETNDVKPVLYNQMNDNRENNASPYVVSLVKKDPTSNHPMHPAERVNSTIGSNANSGTVKVALKSDDAA